MATAMLQSSSPLDDSEDNEDVSFLDDIDIDEIANCLKQCSETTTRESCIKSESSTNTIKNGTPTLPHSSSLSSLSSDNDVSESPSKNRTPRKYTTLECKIEKRMLALFGQNYTTSIIHIGKYSTILKCKDTACSFSVIKILKDLYHGKAKQKMLMQVQKSIPKDNLFSVYFHAGFKLKNRWCFRMEFYPKTLRQAMREYRKSFHINKVQDLARQLVTAVTVLKYNDIVHSDIKPSHILLDSSNQNLRLCGFDAARYFGAKNIGNFTDGTLHYRSPELILGYSSGFSIDVWSTATVLLEMATGVVVFPGYTNNDILYRQMCMIGPIPHEMLNKSKYKSRYFAGNMFKQRPGSQIKISNISKLYETNQLAKMVLDAQTYFWLKDKRNSMNTEERRIFFKKIDSFNKLVKQMVAIVPEERCSIDIAYSDPFIYEMFD